LQLFATSLLNGVTYGLLLFMLSAGLTLIFSMMGVLNFAHASFYMLGAYFGYVISTKINDPELLEDLAEQQSKRKQDPDGNPSEQ